MWLRLRLRRATVVYWTAALALALATAAVVSGLVRGAEEQAARFGDIRRVLVARRSVDAGAVLRTADVTFRDMPAAFVPAGAMDAAPVGHTVIVPLAAGEVVLSSKIAPSGLRGVAALLRPGERALAVPLGPGTPPLVRGDTVDVLSTDPATGATDVAARRARVVDVDDRAVTVAVDSRDAPAVAAALAAATVTLALTTP